MDKKIGLTTVGSPTFCPNPWDVFKYGLCTLFYQSRISEVSVLASTRENGTPRFLYTCGTIYCWETGVHISAFNKVLLQLKLHWACDYFLIYSTVYLAWPNKKFYWIRSQKLTGAEHHTHTQYTTQHIKNNMSRCLLTPSSFPYISMVTSIRSRKQGDTDGTSNIVLPCPSS
jgi:hypothetical protein